MQRMTCSVLTADLYAHHGLPVTAIVSKGGVTVLNTRTGDLMNDPAIGQSVLPHNMFLKKFSK